MGIDMKMTVGFIGVGTIGAPMARNIQRAGFPLIVCDSNPSASDAFVRAGARAMTRASEVAAASDLVITMLPDSPDVEAVATGPDGIASAIRPGRIYMDMSTIDPGTTRRVAVAIRAAGARMVDAPVARAVEDAEKGTLAIMIGGEPADVAEVRPVLEVMGNYIVHAGPLGNGHALKLVNNYVSAGILALHAEALAFGMKAGLSLEKIVELVGSTGASSAHLLKIQPAKSFIGDFRRGFMTRLAAKDVRLALAMAKDAGVGTPVGFGLQTSLKETCDRGYDTDDISSVVRLREDEAGIKIRYAGST
jgi:3-hydroxyisobutyrate dehydrogenase-like beta-hydroxyacid dehydrogenase